MIQTPVPCTSRKVWTIRNTGVDDLEQRYHVYSRRVDNPDTGIMCNRRSMGDPVGVTLICTYFHHHQARPRRIPSPSRTRTPAAAAHNTQGEGRPVA